MHALRPARVLLALVCTLALSAPAWAQTTTGTITGTVRDQQSGVIPGATVGLVSATRGTRVPEVITNAAGDFIFVNLAPDTYNLTVTMSGFKTLTRADIAISAGDRLPLPALVIEVGGMSETVDVSSEAAVIQAQSGERSFTATRTQIENLPLSSRSFIALATLAPGVRGDERIGGGGSTNYVMDGVSSMDTGSNSPILQMNTESIAEVKVLVSNYQAEYGRASGLQIAAVTKSGTNRFHGSVYDVERSSDWRANSQTNILNGDPKAYLRERDWGYSIGGPVGKPGATNKLFFFYAQEFAPRTGGGNIVRHRFPTLAERAGDFSKSTNNEGVLYNLIRDASTGLPCTSSNNTGCFGFQEGIIGKIPASRLYQPGLNILKMYPEPNVDIPGAAYNYELTRPQEELIAWQPAVRLDYQPWDGLRVSGKISAWGQPRKTILGNLPGFNDTQVVNPFVSTTAFTVNYTLNASTFFEGTFGRAQNELTGCAFAQGGTGPSFCRNALSMNPIANRLNAGLADLPFLYPDAQVLDPRYYAFRAAESVQPAYWDGRQFLLPPNFSWGNRITNNPPNVQFPGYLNVNRTNEVSVSVTRVTGRHTIKAGFYNTRSYKAQQTGGWNGTLNFGNDSNNPIDSTFGFSNAALGIFSSYSQLERYTESSMVFNNAESYVQDNWKINPRLTLDYGIRFVHQGPAFDQFAEGRNFLPESWNAGDAPLLYVPSCLNASPCSGSQRVAKNPRTGETLPAIAIGTIVPNSGNQLNGIAPESQARNYAYAWPTMAYAPRTGAAYDVTGDQSIVLRGGGGIFFDRPSATNCAICRNPPNSITAQRNYATLSDMAAGVQVISVPGVTGNQDSRSLPWVAQWNAEVQMRMPGQSSLSVAYSGTHSSNKNDGVALNNADYGAAYLPENQDSTLAASTVPGATALPDDLYRPMLGYAGVSYSMDRARWSSYHSLSLSWQRRYANGFSFGFNDTWSLANRGNSGARVEHLADGSVALRADQAEADRILAPAVDRVHVLKGNAVWDLPDLEADGGVMRVVGAVANDWQLSAVWTGSTGAAYDVGFSYSGGIGNKNLTGAPSYGARIQVVGDPGAGCSGDPLRQFTTGAFAGPQPGSVGLESGVGYLRGCFEHSTDIAIARNIRVGGGRSVQIRADLFNAFNQAGITGRNTTMNIANLSSSTVATNLPFDTATGEVIPTRARPNGAGFGVANAYQGPFNMQLQVRFSF